MINIKGFLSILLINYEILSYKVDDINFYDEYNTLYNYLNYFFNFNVEETLIKNQSFLKDLSKGFKLKRVCITNDENNIEKAYDDLVFNDKKIDDVFYKNVKKELSDKNNTFQETRKLFDLRVEIYKKLTLAEENLKFEKIVGDTVKLKNQKDNLSETPEQKEFIKYIEDKSKTIDYNLFKEYFILKYLVLWQKNYLRQKKKENNELVKLIRVRWSNLKDETEKMSEDEKETEKPHNQIQQGLGLKILTPKQMLSRLSTTLAELKAGNNSEKLRDEIRQLLYSLYRSKKI